MNNQSNIATPPPSKLQTEAAFCSFYEAKANLDLLKKQRKEIEKEEIEVGDFLTIKDRIKELKGDLTQYKEQGIERAEAREDHKEILRLTGDSLKTMIQKSEGLLTIVSEIEAVVPLQVAFNAEDGQHVAWIETDKKVLIDTKQAKFNI